MRSTPSDVDIRRAIRRDEHGHAGRGGGGDGDGDDEGAVDAGVLTYPLYWLSWPFAYYASPTCRETVARTAALSPACQSISINKP